MSRLDAPCDRISSRDHFAMTLLSSTLGKDGQHHSQAHPHLPKLLLPSKPHRHKASFMTEFTGTSCRVQGMLFLPPTSPPIPALLPLWAGEWTLCGTELWTACTGMGMSEPGEGDPCKCG